MATNAPRRTLIVKIQRQLSSLSTSQLQVVARSIDDGNVTSIEELSDTDLYELIVDYLRSEKLQSLEDEGMSQLLLLDDLITDLQRPMDATATGVEEQANIQMEDPTTPSLAEDRDIGSPPRSFTAHQSMLPKLTKTVGPPLSMASPSSSIRNQVLSLSDVASLLPRREFKLHGGQISDTGSDISYGNLCKQVDEGLQEGFTESEVIRSVLKITKPGTFKEMLNNKSDLSVDELKRFLRSHIRDKNSTELFQELSNAK